MQGTHTLTLRLKTTSSALVPALTVEWQGDETCRVLNWWVTGDDREVDTAVHTFTPSGAPGTT